MFILQRRQQLMTQPAKKLLPEPARQRDAALHQRRRQVRSHQLRKDGMLQIVEQDGTPDAGPAVTRLQVGRGIRRPRAGRITEKNDTRKSSPAWLSLIGRTVLRPGYGLDKIRLFFFFRPNISVI
jgi:DNA-binding helix-hairpin-helix protein with protein kinase domain